MAFANFLNQYKNVSRVKILLFYALQITFFFTIHPLFKYNLLRFLVKDFANSHIYHRQNSTTLPENYFIFVSSCFKCLSTILSQTSQLYRRLIKENREKYMALMRKDSFVLIYNNFFLWIF